MNQLENSIWITWEDHRRSRELAKAFGSKYMCLIHDGHMLVRYFVLSMKTLNLILKVRPKVVFCQNPSIVLNFLLVIFKKIFNYKLIVDRHSNFKFRFQNSKNPKWLLFNYLSKVTLKKSDLIIVTNEFLRSYVESLGGKAAVLEDKLPHLNYIGTTKLEGQVNFVFISTFSDDEPIIEIAEAAQNLPDFIKIYITGNYRKYRKLDLLNKINKGNLIFTGFLPETNYQSLLNSADIIVVITDQEHTLTCGAYEAVELEKPMVLSNTSCIKNYFNKGAIYSTPTSEGLASSLLAAIEKRTILEQEVTTLKSELIQDWNLKFAKLFQNVINL